MGTGTDIWAASGARSSNHDGKEGMSSEWLGSCQQCGANDVGWNGPGGAFHCRGCWGQWLDGGWKAAGTGETSRNKGAALLCASFKRRRCDCPKVQSGRVFGCGCADMWPSLTATIEDPDEDEEITRLSHMYYGDSHCHLEWCLLNHKYGSSIWTFKKWICKDWRKGFCHYGSGCDLAHGEADRFVPPRLTEEDVREFAVAHGVPASSSSSKPVRGNYRLEDVQVGAGAPMRGPRLQFVIHNCVEEEAIPDTRTLMQCSDSVFGGTLYCTVGCHPHHYDDYCDALEARLLDCVRSFGDKVVGWGECGLDYYKNFYDAQSLDERKKMVGVFARQAKLAVSLKLPLVVHSRDAVDDTLSVLRELPRNYPVHLHSFQGSLEVACTIMDLLPNCMVGLTGVITMKKVTQNMYDLARSLPLDRMLLETDAPYLSSDPAFIPKIAYRVAKLRGVTAEEVMQQTSRNCQRLYSIGEFSKSRSQL